MFTTRPELVGTFGMVASTHWLASAAAMGILERGGNAFDAGATAGLVLQVVEPHLNGPLGDAPILVQRAEAEAPQVICGQGPAPAGATIAHYKAEGLDLVPGSGHLAAVVPGAMDAWLTMLRDHGTMELRDIIEPAIYYAREGFPLVDRISAAINAVSGLFREHWSTSAALYLPGDKVPAAGSLFRNPALAETWSRLVKESEAAGDSREQRIDAARRQLSQGFIAEEIDRFVRETSVFDASGTHHKGVLTGQDLASWEASYETPLHYDYHGLRVFKCGPWSQGPVLLQQLALLRDLGLSEMDPLGPEFVHTVIEAAKLAYADREAFYGDPDFVEVPVETLLSDAYNAERRKLIGHQASGDFTPGTIPGYGGAVEYRVAKGPVDPALAAAGVGEPTVSKAGEVRGDTCHVDVVDRWGNMVAATPSGGWFQSNPTIPSLGMALGSRAQMFWLEEGRPASLAPGKRPRTTLTPSMAHRDGKPYLAFGTPGGDQQDQWSLTMFVRHVHHMQNLQEAIDAPMFHIDHMPSSFYPREAKPKSVSVETRFPEATLKELEARGHDLSREGDWALGRLSAVARDPDGKRLRAAANPRFQQGYAVGR